MVEFSIVHLTSLEALRSQASAWDDLWRRSALTHVTARAAIIEHWVRTFADVRRFQAITVWQQDRMIAALPLVTRRNGRGLSRGLGRWLTCLDVPGNEWSSAGQLLLDPVGDVACVCDVLVAELLKLKCAAFWFASIPCEAPWWQSFVDAVRRAGCDVDLQQRYRIGRLEVRADAHDQEAAWSKGFRKKLRRSIRQLESLGRLRLRVECPATQEAACRLLQRGWQLEHAGWKGRATTSILANPDARAYLQQQASHLAAWRHLQIALLEHDDRLIAFEYGWRAKQTYHSYKVAYNEQYGRFSPGQILVYALLNRFRDDSDIRAIDFLGPLDDAVRRWRPADYAMGRLLCVPPGPFGRALLFASRHVLPPLCAASETC